MISELFELSYRRRLIDKALFRHAHLLKGRVLDLGGGRTRGRFPNGTQAGWVVADIDLELKPRVVADAQVLPFKSSSFDAVKCSELTGYLYEPKKMVDEIDRILKPGGMAVVTSPFLTPYDHNQHDCVRLTNAWWEWAAKKTGLAIEKLEPQGFLLTVVSDFEKYWISHWWPPLRYAAYLLLFPVYEILFWYEKHFPVPEYFCRFTTGFLIVFKKVEK